MAVDDDVSVLEAVVQDLRRQYGGVYRVMRAAYAVTEAAIRAINSARIHYYLNKPWDPPEEKLYPVVGFQASISHIDPCSSPFPSCPRVPRIRPAQPA